MTFRVDPATITGIASDLDRSTQRVGFARPLPTTDAGPSTAAVSATVAEVLRAIAGAAETASATADDLNANKVTYVGTEDANEAMFRGFAR